MKGNYIVFEGVENSGKTTQSEMIAGYLRSRGVSVIKTREPGGTSLGNGIRYLLLDKTSVINSPEAELFLFEAARAESFKEIIIPSLKRGEQIIADRNYFSSEAYQGYGRGMDIQMVRNLNDIATYGTKPDLAFIFDFPVEEALKKANKDRIESLSLEFHKRVRQGFLEIASRNPDFSVVINRENRNPEEIHEEVKHHLKNRLGL